MSPEAATYVVRAAQAYLAVGAAFAIVFALFLVGRVDPAVKGSSWGFRVMILPGSALLWPLLLGRVVRGAAPPEEHSAHRACAVACPLKNRPNTTEGETP